MTQAPHQFQLNKANIELTQNGVRSKTFDDIYFQPDFAIQESLHTFCLGNDLEARFKGLGEHEHFYLAELGFGSGLNVATTLKLWHEHAPKTATLHYYSFEKYPLKLIELRGILSDFKAYTDEIDVLLKIYPALVPGIHRRKVKNFELTLCFGDCLTFLTSLCSVNSNVRIDAWFLDGFAPQKNPLLWSSELFKVIAELSTKEQTTLATFSVSRDIRKRLQQAGFHVKKRGGIGKKREVLSAVFSKEQAQEKPNKTPWYLSATNPYILSRNSHIAVIGGGLAGCIMAHTLAREGVQITLYERGSQLALAGSGNRQAVCDFKPSLYRSPYNDFMLAAFMFSSTYYQRLQAFESSNLLRIIDSDKYHQELIAFFERFPDIGEILSSEKVKSLTGVTLPHFACYINGGGYISPHKLCQKLTNHKNISLSLKTSVKKLYFDDGQWVINDRDTVDGVIWACASNPTLLDSDTQYVTDYPGQNIEINPSTSSRKLNITLTGYGHLCPYNNGMQTLSDSEFLMQLFNLDEGSIRAIRYAKRAKTYDYLPMVGPLPMRQPFIKTFGSLKKDKNFVIPHKAPCYPNVYLLTGFGSHGVTSIPYCAEIIKDHLLGRLSMIDVGQLKHIAPQRLLLKEIVKR